MGIRVEVSSKGSHIRDICVIQGENSLTVNLLDWWEQLTSENAKQELSSHLGNIEYFPPQAIQMVGQYPNYFSRSLKGDPFPLYDEEEAKDFQSNIDCLQQLGYNVPVTKGRHRNRASSWSVYVTGFSQLLDY